MPILIDFVPNPDPVATEEFVPSLLEGEGFVLSGLLEVGRSNASIFVFEEQLIGFLNSLADILYGLRTHLQPPGVPFPKLGDVFLQSGAVQVLAPHSVVPFVEGNTMVVDTPCGIDCPLEVSISLVLVELELERFHGCYDTSVSRLNKFSPSLISPVWKTGALRFTFVISMSKNRAIELQITKLRVR